MDSDPMIYEQGQNKMGSFLDGNTQERYMCTRGSWYNSDERHPYDNSC